jgi:quinol monooxygenase YgiN
MPKYNYSQTEGMKVVEMDYKLTLCTQLEEDVGPVIVMIKFNVDPDEVDEFLKEFKSTAEFMKQQPGFISAQLHRGIAGSNTFVNYVVWESVAHFKNAFNKAESRPNKANVLPKTIASLHIGCSWDLCRLNPYRLPQIYKQIVNVPVGC